MSEPSELIELLEWLETTGRKGSGYDFILAALRGESRTCVAIGWDDTHLEEGIFETHYYLPVKKVLAAVGVDEQLLDESREWLEAVSSREFRADIVDDEEFGRCFVLRMLYYVPSEAREGQRRQVEELRKEMDVDEERPRLDLTKLTAAVSILREFKEKIISVAGQEAVTKVEGLIETMKEIIESSRSRTEPFETEHSYVLLIHVAGPDGKGRWEQR